MWRCSSRRRGFACAQSPNVAEVHDFVAQDGHYFVIMEWIDGIDLGSWIKWH